jgi:hypothetical protein
MRFFGVSMLVVLWILLYIVVTPLLTIWSMNTLFPSLAIPYNLDTWCAVILLVGAVNTTIKVSK